MSDKCNVMEKELVLKYCVLKHVKILLVVI